MWFQGVCASRSCQGYDPSQMWYYSKTDGMLRQSTYTASINHRITGAGYVLTEKVPTWRHHCLSHALSITNEGSASGMQEVWGGPLAGGSYVLALLNRGTAPILIDAPFTLLEIKAVTAGEPS